MSGIAFANFARDHFQLWNKWWFWGTLTLIAAGCLIFDIGYSMTADIGFPWYIPWVCLFTVPVCYYQLFRVLKINPLTLGYDIIIPFTLVDMMAVTFTLLIVTTKGMSAIGAVIIGLDMAFVVCWFHYSILKLSLKDKKEAEL